MFDIGMPTYSPTTPLAFIFDEEAGRPDMYQTPTCYKKEKDSSSLKCDKLPLMRDSYMGLSVATSNAINPGSNEVFYAAGAPRGNHTGAVVFFRKNTDSSGDITLVPDPANVLLGETIGSSFGYAIALTDINGDGLDDLIVGAPQYYEYSNQNKRGGAVYIYLNGQSGMSNVEPQVIYGQPDSYFGHSVAALGDIDQDGYNDFAVGAPYENENGVVHIFRGSNEGKPIKAQVVNAIDYTKLEGSGIENIVGFGASLSGQVDADSNKYPDLLIGTLSDQVALLRTRPIISVNMSFDISLTEIDLEDKNCSTPGGNHACFDISYCFVYHARHDEYSENVDITYKLTLDSIRQDELKSPRVNFHTIDGPSVIKRKLTLPKAGEKVCPEQDSHLIFFNNGAEDKLSDIGLKMEFDLDLDEIEREKIGEEIFNMIKDPILDADLDKEKQKIVRIKTSCGDDGCQSDLKLSASMPEEVVVGDESELPVKILVVNDGEEAHQSFLTVSLPPNIDFNNYTVEDQSSRIVCYPTTSDKLSFIKCDLGNPYKPETKDEIKIILGVSRLTPQDKLIELEIKGSTSSENPDIAPILLKARVMIELDISLNVFAQPEQVWYREKEILGESGMQTTEDIGPLTVYTFNVINQGSQPASGIVVNIDFPMEINNGKWLLYLVASDVIAGSPVPAGTCSGNYVNVLQLDPRLQAPANIRSKRETESYSKIAPEAEVTASGGFISKITFACNKRSTRCVNIKCNLDEIESQSTTSIILQIHVWEPTFLEEFTHVDLVHIQTQISLTSSIENVRFKGNKTHGMVQTTVDHDFFKTDIRSTFPWWYILLAIIALLLIYILVIFILLKCGFFRRKRYSHTANDEDDSKVVLEEVRKRDADEGTEI
uniref:integrin alpha-6-like n=1 Tax=Styela clava TaxID=7725 RepID=UPI00193AD98E|nr:integrin alpha-6-like [Styela clava]